MMKNELDLLFLASLSKYILIFIYKKFGHM